MQEKRLIERLKQHWLSLKGDGVMPDMRQLNPDMISDLWGRCLVLEVVHNPANRAALYSYDYMGKDIITAYGSDLTDHYVNVHMHNFPGWQVLQSIDKMLAQPDVYEAEGSFVADTHKVVKYRAILLPFGSEKKMTHVLVGLSWKELG